MLPGLKACRRIRSESPSPDHHSPHDYQANRAQRPKIKRHRIEDILITSFADREKEAEIAPGILYRVAGEARLDQAKVQGHPISVLLSLFSPWRAGLCFCDTGLARDGTG